MPHRNREDRLPVSGKNRFGTTPKSQNPHFEVKHQDPPTASFPVNAHKLMAGTVKLPKLPQYQG